MTIEVLESDDNKLKVKIDDLTLVNLLNDNIWKQKNLKYSAYNIDHPYMAKPVLLIKSKDPKKTLIDAADQIIEDVKDLKKQVAALK
jgi:DNA-directed RNA polymerase subunit L